MQHQDQPYYAVFWAHLKITPPFFYFHSIYIFPMSFKNILRVVLPILPPSLYTDLLPSSSVKGLPFFSFSLYNIYVLEFPLDFLHLSFLHVPFLVSWNLLLFQVTYSIKKWGIDSTNSRENLAFFFLIHISSFIIIFSASLHLPENFFVSFHLQ